MEAAIEESRHYKKSLYAILPSDPPDVTPQRNATATYHSIRDTLQSWFDLWVGPIAITGFVRAPFHPFGRMESQMKDMWSQAAREDPHVSKAAVEHLRREIVSGFPMHQPLENDTRQLNQNMYDAVQRVVRDLRKAPILVLDQSVMEDAAALLKGYEHGWLNLSFWQRVVATVYAHRIKLILDRHGVPEAPAESPAHSLAHSVYEPVPRQKLASWA